MNDGDKQLIQDYIRELIARDRLGRNPVIRPQRSRSTIATAPFARKLYKSRL